MYTIYACAHACVRVISFIQNKLKEISLQIQHYFCLNSKQIFKNYVINCYEISICWLLRLSTYFNFYDALF